MPILQKIKYLLLGFICLIVVLLLIPVWNFWFGKTPTYTSICYEHNLKRAFSYVSQEKYAKAAACFPYDTSSLENPRSKTPNETERRLAAWADKGGRISSIDSVSTDYNDGFYRTDIAITLTHRNERYSCLIECGNGAPMNVREVYLLLGEKKKPISRENFPQIITEFSDAIQTYNPG